MLSVTNEPLLNQRVADAMRDDTITEAEYKAIRSLKDEIDKARAKRQIRAILKQRNLE
jgi:hypothetical protein